MDSSSYQPKKLFTIEEANASLPLVRAIVTDLAGLSRDVIERRQRLSYLKSDRDSDATDVYAAELEQVEQDLDLDGQRLREYVEELRVLGVEPKNGPEGLVDFPSLMDGRIVYLCWKLSEPEVAYWHELEAGFRGRQPLAAQSAVESGGLDDDLDAGEGLGR